MFFTFLKRIWSFWPFVHYENFETNYTECLLVSLSFAMLCIYLNLDSFDYFKQIQRQRNLR